jgi:nucleoside-diphosphate-sugar epimerase
MLIANGHAVVGMTRTEAKRDHLRSVGAHPVVVDALDADAVKRAVGEAEPDVGTGVWPFIHIEDAAAATLNAVEVGPAGTYNIVDDEPAPVSEWLPVLAAGRCEATTVGAALARAPRGGRVGGAGADRDPRRRERQGQARARLAAALPTWRQGFAEGLA